MTKKATYMISAMAFSFLLYNIFSCTTNENSNLADDNRSDSPKINNISPYIKPPSTYHDTLIIRVPTAVFFNPDSLQLERIKQLADSKAFQGSMHEYFYLMRFSHNVLKKLWPWLPIIDSKTNSHLLFIKKDGQSELINLNSTNDACGLYVFNGQDSPVMVDMANIESEVPFILNK